MKPYFQNGSVTLYHGDCFEILPTFAPGTFDAAITDPPYGNGENKWDVTIDCGILHGALRTVCKVNSAKVFFADFRLGTRLLAEDGKSFRYDLVWDKSRNSSPADANRRPLRCHENILVFYDKLPTYNPQMWQSFPYSQSPACCKKGRRFATLGSYTPSKGRTERYPRSIIYCSASYDSKGFGGYEFGNHPTQKPVSIIEWLTKTYTNEGQSIIDPFAGSGTAGVAAMRTGRKAVLIEREEQYCEMAAKRLQQEATAK